MVYEGPGGLCVPAHPYEMPIFAASAFRCKLHGLWLCERWCEAPAKHVHEHSYRHSSPHATALSLPDCCQGRSHIATLSGVHQFLSAAARALPAGAADCASGEWRRKHHPRRERAKARWQWWQRRHFRRLLPWNHRLSSSNKRPTGCPFLGQLVQEWPPSFATQQESLKPPRFIHYHLQTPSKMSGLITLHHFIEAHHASSYLINFIMPCHPPSYTSSYFTMLPCTTRDFVIHHHASSYLPDTSEYHAVLPNHTLSHLTIPCSTSWCLIIPTPQLPYHTSSYRTLPNLIIHTLKQFIISQRTPSYVILIPLHALYLIKPCFTSSYLPNLIPHYTCLKHHHNCYASSNMNRYLSKLHQASSCLRNSDLPYRTSQCFVKPHPTSSTSICHTSSVFFTPDHTSACLLILCQTSSRLIVLHGSSSSIVKPTSHLKKPHQRSKLLIPHHAASYLYHIPYLYLILTVPQTLSKLVMCHDHLLSYLINVHSSS